jgi:signal transduction histidine kinase/CheY-like chemotaxis protein
LGKNDSQLSPYLNILAYEDTTGIQTAEQIFNKLSLVEGAPLKNDVANFWVTDSSFWFYFEVNNQSPQNNWQLLIEHHLIREVDLYRMNNSNWQLELQSGTARPWSQRLVENAYFIYPIEQKTKTQRYLLRVLNQDPLLVPYSFITQSKLQLKLNQALWTSGLYWGLLIALLAYNLFIFLSTKEISYLYYVLYVASFAGYLMVHESWSHKYAFSGINWLSNHAIHLSIPISLCFAFLFTSQFLNLKKELPKLHSICLYAISWNLFLLILYFFISSSFHSLLMMATVLIFAILIIYISIASWTNRNPDAPFFLLAWSFLISGAVITNLMYSNILPFNWFTASASHIGASGEMLLLSFALAAKINRVHQQKANADFEHQKILKENLHLLDKSNQIKDRFLNVISHELRTPLHGIRASLDIVVDKQKDDKVAKELALLDSSAEEMERRVTDLLVFTDLASGSFKLNYSAFNSKDLIETLYQKFKRLAEDKCIMCQFSCDEMIPEWLVGDKQYLILIYSQLLDNAIKFTSTGTVSTFFDLNAQGELLVTIKDTGIGFKDNMFDKLDQAFEQADSSLSRERGGLGLGLTLSQQLVTLMNGRITIDTDVLEGAGISIELPLKEATKQQIKEILDVKNASMKPNKVQQPKDLLTQIQKEILIVEDNHVNRMVIAHMVEHLGHKVTFARNGEIAVKLCQNQVFDLILMDCQMPVMDGIEATKIIRQNGKNKDTPIIAVTANAMSNDNNISLAAGMNQHLAKPVRLPELTLCINRWLNLA